MLDKQRQEVGLPEYQREELEKTFPDKTGQNYQKQQLWKLTTDIQKIKKYLYKKTAIEKQGCFNMQLLLPIPSPMSIADVRINSLPAAGGG